MSTISAAPLTKAQMTHCLETLRRNFCAADVVSKHDGKLVIRWRKMDARDSIIVKMWSRADLNARLRRAVGVAACNHEWRNLVRMKKFGVAVPHPLGFLRVVPSIAGYTDVLFMEDLGQCVSATEHLKELIRNAQDEQTLHFENVLITMTKQIVDAGMLDVDHGMLNIVVDPSGRPVKLDVELARRVIWPPLFPVMYSRMLARLIGLHAFAVQPEVERTMRFAERLRFLLKPSPSVLQRVTVFIRQMMETQRQRTGIKTNVILPWN